MGKFVNPFTDLGFKIIFGQPASKPFLITLLNELLAGEHRIEDLEFLDKEDHAEHVRDKGIIYDLYCRTSTGEYIIVEMQNRKHPNFLDRTLYYMCRAVSRQVESPVSVSVPGLDTGEEGMEIREPSASYGTDYKLSVVYGVFFMNFKEPDLPDRFRVDAGILDMESHETLNPRFRQIYLQFPYFTKELDECETLLERLFYALKNMEHWIRMPDTLKEQVFAHLSRLAAVANLSPENRLAYDRAVDRYNVNRLAEEGFLREVEEAKEKAIAEAVAEAVAKAKVEAEAKGMKDGLEKGMEKGMEEGMEEARLEMARQLKLNGVPTDIIARSSGLPTEEIERL